LASPLSHSHSASDMPSASGNVCAAAVTTTVIEPGGKQTLDSDKEVTEKAFDRRQLELLKSAVVDTQELYTRCMATVQESQELLQQVDELLMRSRQVF